MSALRRHPVITMVLCLHIGWLVSLPLFPIQAGGVATPIWHLTEIFGRGTLLELVLLFTSLSAVSAVLNVPRLPLIWRFLGLVPQQVIITISGFDSLLVAATGNDHTGGYFFREQWLMVLASIFHAIAIVRFHRIEPEMP